MNNNNNNTFAVIAIVSAQALFEAVIATIASTMQLQEAKARDCTNSSVPGGGSIAFNA